MEWTQFLIFIVSFVGLFYWNRTESRADIRHMDNKIDAMRELIREIHNENASMMKDFHERLLKIEITRK